MALISSYVDTYKDITLGVIDAFNTYNRFNSMRNKMKPAICTLELQSMIPLTQVDTGLDETLYTKLKVSSCLKQLLSKNKEPKYALVAKLNGLNKTVELHKSSKCMYTIDISHPLWDVLLETFFNEHYI